MDGIRNLVERFVAFENRWDACEREVRTHVDAERLAGIREAIELLETEYELIIIPKSLRAKLLPPPSGGEKAECTCNLIWKFYSGSDVGRAARNACPVHAPKPAAEKR